MSDTTDLFRRAIPAMRPNVSPVTTAGVGGVPSSGAATRSVMDAVNNTKVSVGSVILIVIAALVLFLVVYKVYDIIRKTSLRKIYIYQGSVSTSTSVDLGAGTTVPEPLAGREYSFSFWFWLDGTDTFNGDKNLLTMGSETYTFTINNHNLKFRAAAAAGATAVVEDTIPVAIQKWTHIMMVVDNNYVTIYKDGDVALSKGITGNFPIVPKSFQVGPKGSGSQGVAGFLAALRYFNYVANAKDVRTTYGKGPMSAGLLRYLGLPMYGIRNPFYRIDGVRDMT